MITFRFQWHDCKSAFYYTPKIPAFSCDGGSYAQFGGSVTEVWQRHLYFFKWCFFTLRYDRIPRRKIKVVFGTAHNT
jgi:hypothetical protein